MYLASAHVWTPPRGYYRGLAGAGPGGQKRWEEILTTVEIYAMIDSLGDVGEALNSGKSESQLYERLGLNLRYYPSQEHCESHVFTACG